MFLTLAMLLLRVSNESALHSHKYIFIHASLQHILVVYFLLYFHFALEDVNKHLFWFTKKTPNKTNDDHHPETDRHIQGKGSLSVFTIHSRLAIRQHDERTNKTQTRRYRYSGRINGSANAILMK